MRARFPLALICVGLVASCAHDDRRVASPGAADGSRGVSGGVSSGPPQYVVADPGTKTNVPPIALGASGALGVVIDKTRIIIGRGEPRMGAETTEVPITFAAPIPQRFGGGFLFIADALVYRADTFDGHLVPIARLPEGVQNYSFAPKFMLLRSRNGERWAFSLPKGDRVAIEPAGAADIEGLDDGRTIAFTDQGLVSTSTDSGAHLVDITAQIKSTPARVAQIDDQVWLIESAGNAIRLEHDGRLSFFDKAPDEKPLEVRPKDPRWRGAESALRTAFHYGAAIDDNTALVIDSGDLVRVDVRTGEVTGVVAGKLPPDAHCKGILAGNDILFACVTAGPQAANAFVVSHVIEGDTPTIEQSFGGVAPFYAGDDGGLAFAGPCTGTPTVPSRNVCVRQPGGTWQELDVSGASDAGTGDVNVVRWIPRSDGHVVALVLDPIPGIYDPRTGALQTLPGEERVVLGQGVAFGLGRRRRPVNRNETDIVDSSWSFSASGTIRGWHRQGGIIEIGDDGRITHSPYNLDIASAGANALGKTHDGRLYQSTDHGWTWTEVAAPPSGGDAIDLRACSTAGCDLGGFYRIGWSARPPRPVTPPEPAKAAPFVQRGRPVELACHPAGPAQTKVLPRTERSPEDLGLGNNRLPITGEKQEFAFVRVPVQRAIANPLREAAAADSDGEALRGLLSGYQTQQGDNGTLEVMGPSKAIAGLRRSLSFVPPFDPAAPIKKASLAFSDVITAGRLAGMSSDEILAADLTEQGTFFPMTSVDPSAPADLAFVGTGGLIAHLYANERVRVGIREVQGGASIVSGAALGADDAVYLELDEAGGGKVVKVAGAGIVTDLYEVPGASVDSTFYPANPDAIAIGPRGDVGIIRTASGSDPASEFDPARLLLPATPPQVLAPWSTLRFADDPSCKGDTGYRTTLQIIAPWIRITTPELRVSEAAMIARVRWSDKRVCLEGIEVRLANVPVRAPSTSGEPIQVATWLVSRGSTFSRVGITEGIEWRQPLECSIYSAPK